MLTFTALLGAQSGSCASQSLLELEGGIKILVDIGWDETFSVEGLRALEEQVSSLSFVLLTHPTLDHLGAFAHFCKHIPQFKSIPVYATSPVIALGRTLLQDLYSSSVEAATIVPQEALAEASYASSGAAGALSILLQPPTQDEIAGYFSLINSLRYSQPLQPIASPFSPSVDGMTITAYAAGHTLGGTIWHIQYGTDSIVYAVDWNQAKENILGGAAWLGGAGGGAEILEPLRRPTAMVCSSRGIERQQVPGGRKRRDDLLLDAIDKTIANGGTVLIPSDSSARILELAFILEQHWRRQIAHGAQAYKSSKIHFASRTAGSTIRLARSMMEWMDDGMVREWEASNDGQKTLRVEGEDRPDQTPFDFRHVKLVERKQRLLRLLDSRRPGVILASDATLSWGFSSDALRALYSDPRNLIILTEQTRADETQVSRSHTAASLLELWRSQTRGSIAKIISAQGASVTLRESKVQSLADDELALYQQYLARRRQMQSTQGEGIVSSINPAEVVADDQSSSSSEPSDDSDNEQQGQALNLSNAMNQNRRRIGLTDAELGVNILLRKKDAYDYDVRGKRGREKIYPFAFKRNRDDEYGDVIRPEDYLRAEERDEDAAADAAKAEEQAAVGQKRKWDDKATRAQDARKQQRTTTKRTRANDDEPLGTLLDSNSGGNGKEDSDEDSDEEPEQVVPTGPQKISFTEETLELSLGICFIDFSGLAEKRDLQMLIPLIRPSKLVITGGSAAETESLAEDCRELLRQDEAGSQVVFAPSTGETVDASVDSNAWSIKLTRGLIKRLAWQNVKGLGVVAVTARLGTESVEILPDSAAEEQRRKKLKLIQGSPESESKTRATTTVEEAVLDVVPATFSITSQQTTQPIHVGDLRLADLRRLMQASGHMAEFRGEGTLLVDGTVVVRKSPGGNICVEGGAYVAPGARHDPGVSFVDVRRRIYEGLAVVAGG